VGITVGGRVSVGGAVGLGGRDVAVGASVGGAWVGASVVGAAPILGNIPLQALVKKSAIKARRFIIIVVSKRLLV